MKSFDPFKRLERSLEFIIERPLDRVFGNTVQPIEISRRLEREIQEKRLIGPNGPIVPNAFDVYLSSADFVSLEPNLTVITDEMTESLEAFTEKKRLPVSGQISISVINDEHLPRGEVKIQSRTEREPETIGVEGPFELTDTHPFAIDSPPHSGPDYRLEILNGALAGVAFSITKRSTLIGRSIDCDIVVSSPDVSRQHAIIECVDDLIRVVDLGSLNGTFVNRRPVQDWSILKLGDVITFGEVDTALDDGYAAYRPPWR